jgi:RNA polymerase sigma-70 factor (ECF subfamily)
MYSTPVIELNRAVAVAMADGPLAGLVLLEQIEQSGALDGYHLFHSAKADLLRRERRLSEAKESYSRALELAGGAANQTFLKQRIAEVTQLLDNKRLGPKNRESGAFV